jgi:membrane protease YdiL (CAAX protease family)
MRGSRRTEAGEIRREADSPADRFSRFEYANDDFPYYNGQPVRISGRQWWLVMLAIAVAFAALTAPIGFFGDKFGQFVPAILFAVVPLVVLAAVAPGQWRAIFRKVRGKDVAWMFGFAAINVVVTLGVGALVEAFFGTAENAAGDVLADATPVERVLFFLKTAPQLFGEELLTVLPFLALLYYFFSCRHTSRKTAIMWAWLLSALVFGLAHLPTYDWNLAQSVIVIGVARLVLSLAYLKTKNIWVSTGAHVINDWILFGSGLLGATVAAIG